MDTEIFYAPLTMADSAEFFHLTGNPRVAATMRFDCPHTREESDRILADYISGGSRCFALRFQPEGRLWGIFAFRGDPDAGTADLSQMQLPEQWGQGLGSRVLRDMVALARRNNWYRALKCHILETNTASRRLAEKQGFHETERHRFPGMTEDLVVYRLEL